MRVSLISNDWIIIYYSLELLGRCAYFMRFPIVLITTTKLNYKCKSHDVILIAGKFKLSFFDLLKLYFSILHTIKHNILKKREFEATIDDEH